MFFVDNFDKPSWPEGTMPEGIEGIWLGHPVKCSWCVIRTPWWGSVQLVIWFGMTGNVNSNHGRADATFVLTFCTFTFRYLGGFSFLHKQPSRCSPCHACYANKNQRFCAKYFMNSNNWKTGKEADVKYLHWESIYFLKIPIMRLLLMLWFIMLACTVPWSLACSLYPFVASR